MANSNQDAEAKAKADAEAKSKADAEAKAKAPQKRRVEVLVDNLGPKLLKRGDVTDDEQYAALIDEDYGRTLVREVK
ncbi:MAG: hypothetical protein MSG64_07470 [Pyrinomonadaceae bacterium MAG19_C2-C3]|nr:hypothetical protein [Pyrinomonadaceae bacterium MAG19_C2-C3]